MIHNISRYIGVLSPQILVLVSVLKSLYHSASSRNIFGTSESSNPLSLL